MVEKETCTSDLYDYIIFYRWRSPYDMYERGQVMARLVAEIIGKECHRVWLDQREMQRSTPPEQVIWKIANIFPRVSQVIILAAPGDWLRFANNDDIHRWEWELSLQSDKKIWLLQYGQHEQTTPFSQQDLVTGFGVYHPRLAELASKKFVSVRVVTMENIDGVIREITTSLLDDS
ncbi:hypothetical protein N7465_010384 [Penicillium sp. CMV-2018d]|nr:hypothetical protein N7465_010384 [Penicillium sp. CMV-2018d]